MGIENIKFPENTKFLVTGGAGFIGSNLTEAILNLGYKVRVLDNFSTGKRENIEGFLNDENFELLEGDIRDIETCRKACEGVDYVLHQAAWGSVSRSIKMPVLYEEINVKGHLYFRLYGLETVGMRYFNVFGRRQDPNGFYVAVIPKFVKQLINNEAPQINGDGETSRDFTYIDNVIEANLKACLAGKKHQDKHLI